MRCRSYYIFKGECELNAMSIVSFSSSHNVSLQIHHRFTEFYQLQHYSLLCIQKWQQSWRRKHCSTLHAFRSLYSSSSLMPLFTLIDFPSNLHCRLSTRCLGCNQIQQVLLSSLPNCLLTGHQLYSMSWRRYTLPFLSVFSFGNLQMMLYQYNKQKGSILYLLK